MNRIESGSWLLTRPIAHRGLHGEGSPENSKAAYLHAVEKGYPIEMDVQLSRDKKLVCFHDDNMKRMTGVDAFVWDKTLGEIREMRLAGSDERIMEFKDFLSFIAGKTPILVEIKTTPDYKTVAQKTVEELKGYTGEFAVQSFDPRIMGVVRKLAPDFLRGQLMYGDKNKEINAVKDFILRKGLLNFISKPDFINMDVNALPVANRIKRGKRVISWTIRNEEDKEKAFNYADNVIFEHIVI